MSLSSRLTMHSLTCTNCGAAVSPGDGWCRQCGGRQTSIEQQHARSTPDPPDPRRQSYIPDYGLPRGSGAAPGWTFAQEGGVWRDGNTLIMHKTARLPDYCIKCGMPANGSHLRKKLSWHHPALLLLVLAGLLIYAIVALIVRKSATVDISLCPDHIRKHRTAVTVSWAIFLAGLAFIVLAIASESGGSALLGVFLILAGAVSGATWAKVVSVKKIDDNYVWLRGIDDCFLSMLPSVSKQ